MRQLYLVLCIAFIVAGCQTARPSGPTCDHGILSGTPAGPSPAPVPPPPGDRTMQAGQAAAKAPTQAMLLLREKISKSFEVRRDNKKKAIEKFIKERVPPERLAPPPPPESYDILLLSAGGQYGAYGSGFLKGWSENTQLMPREGIDMVTGVSTGALMATYAYLGSSSDPVVRAKYDNLLKTEYTTLNDADLFRKRSVIELLWANSIYDSEPLHKRVENIITTSLLDEIVAEAETGRLLFVGAVNLDNGEFEVYDLVTIARDTNQERRRACYIAAVLASSAIPATFNAVFINDHMYTDGGIRRQAFFVEQAAAALPDPLAKNMFGFLHGDLAMPEVRTDNNLIGVVSRSVSIINDQLLTDSAFYIDTKAKAKGYGRSWAAPAHSGCANTSPEGHKFDPALGTCLWNRGYDDAKSPRPWKSLDELLQ
jgi:hypothetical protein